MSNPCLPSPVRLCIVFEVRDEGYFHIVSINVVQGDLGLFSPPPASCFFSQCPDLKLSMVPRYLQEEVHTPGEAF